MSVLGLGKKNFIFSNWAHIHSCRPQLYFQPSSLDEIVQLVLLAKEQGKTLLTVGSGHSPSDLVMTDDWLVNLDKYNNLLSVSKDASGLFADVTVEAGMRLFQLHHHLAENGLAMQNMGSISDQSVAGVISTGTHGASPYHGLISQQIVDLTIVNGKGEIVFCNAETNTDVFRAAMLSLGKIGIIVKATIRTIPSFKVRSSEEVISFDTLLERWETLWVSSEFIRVWWYPYAKKCVLWTGCKTEEPTTAPRQSWWGTKFGRFFYEALLWIAVNIYPPFTPSIEKFVFNRQFGNVEAVGDDVNNVANSVQALNMDCLFSQFVNEWAAPLNNGPEILRSLEHSISMAAQNHDFYVHVPIEIRCSNTTGTNDTTNKVTDLQSRTALSSGPLRGNNLRPYLDNTPQLNYVPLSDVTNSQLTLYINATMYRPFCTNSPIGKWYKIFEETMGAAGGKPHWAKNFIGSVEWADGETKQEQNYHDGEMRGFAAKNREWFGSDLDEFKRVRSEQDPDDVFMCSKQWFVKNGFL